MLLPVHRAVAFRMLASSRLLRHPRRRFLPEVPHCILMDVSMPKVAQGHAPLGLRTFIVDAPHQTCVGGFAGLLHLSGHVLPTCICVQAIVAQEPPAFQLRPDTLGRSGLAQQGAGNDRGQKVHPMQHVLIMRHQLARITWHTSLCRVSAPYVAQTFS